MTDNAETPANDQGQYRYLLTFTEPGLLHQAPPGERFDMVHMAAARDTLIAQQAAYRQAMCHSLGRSLDISHHYLVTHSGLAVWLTEEEAEAVTRLAGVAAVEREREYELATTHGPWFIGADTIWDGTNVPDNIDLRGEGMVLAVLDTGIDPAHPAFANDPDCGFGAGSVPDKVLSVLDCDSTDDSGLCNGSSPIDTHFHGTHVASTAAGNSLDESAEPPPSAPISGVAPCAYIRSYKTCPGSSCPGANLVAGFNSVLLHGDVDVMNYSISGGNDPWNDGDRIKLDLVQTGVLVAAAAGNTNPSTPSPVAQVNHRGPWVLSVASGTHDGTGNQGLLSVSGPGTPPDELRAMVVTAGTESPTAPELLAFPIRHFDQQPPGWEGCTPGEDDGHGNVAPADMEPFPENFFDGAAALILRGGCAFAAKIANAFEAGAELVIIRNDSFEELIIMNTAGQPDVPAYLIAQTFGNDLQAFISDHPETAVIDFDPVSGDVLSDFSFRGPTPQPLQHLTKPDIAAPGDLVYAAVPESVAPEGYGYSGGTSMATPHVAGAALLLRQAHPDWTVPEVMSALMTTAKRTGYKENLIDAWNPDDVGSGRVDLTRAALAGLVMHETGFYYLTADPAEGGDVRTLNTPSLRNLSCTAECTWTRTVRNTLDVPSQWTVTGTATSRKAEVDRELETTVSSSRGPGSSPGRGAPGEMFEIIVEPETFEFTGESGETQELSITVKPLETLTTVTFGEVVLTEAGAQSPDQRLTVAVHGRPAQPVAAFDAISLEATLEQDETETRTLTIDNLGELSLDWQITEQAPVGAPRIKSGADASGSVIAAKATPTDTVIDCDNHPDLIIQDTGIIDRGYNANPNTTSQVLFVDRFTPGVVPATIPAVCVAIVTPFGAGETEFEIVVFDDDGPGGRPSTELGALSVTADGLPQQVGIPAWRSFDLAALDIEVKSGSVYIGIRSALPTSNRPYIGADESPINPPAFAGGWSWTAPQDVWVPIQDVSPSFENYRALFVRPVVGIGDIDCTLPGWIDLDGMSGTVEPGNGQTLAITFDAAGLELGSHTATLCLETNDPQRPLATLPLTLIRPGPLEDPIFSDRFETN